MLEKLKQNKDLQLFLKRYDIWTPNFCKFKGAITIQQRKLATRTALL